MILFLILVFLAVTHQIILVNEEFFVAFSFILCFVFLLFNVSSMVVEFQELKISEIRKTFVEILQTKIRLLGVQKEKLVNYKKFMLYYKQLIHFCLYQVESKIQFFNKRIVFVLDNHFRVLLNGLLSSYILYVEKVMYAFVETSYQNVIARLSKPMYYVSFPKNYEVFSYIQTITLPEEKQVNGFFSKSFIKNKFFISEKKVKQEDLIKFKILQVFFKKPVFKNGAWTVLFKSRTMRIWFALRVFNPYLIF